MNKKHELNEKFNEIFKFGNDLSAFHQSILKSCRNIQIKNLPYTKSEMVEKLERTKSKILEDLKKESQVIEEELLCELATKPGDNVQIDKKENSLVNLQNLIKKKEEKIQELKSKFSSEELKAVIEEHVDNENINQDNDSSQLSLNAREIKNKEIYEKEVKQLREEIKLQLSELYKMRKNNIASFVEAKTRRIRIKAVSLRKQVQSKEVIIEKLYAAIKKKDEDSLNNDDN